MELVFKVMFNKNISDKEVGTMLYMYRNRNNSGKRSTALHMYSVHYKTVSGIMQQSK